MTEQPRVSVIIPVRDDARHLERCLLALAAQTTPPWEVVVVDNGSTDDTAAVALAHGARVVPEPRVGIPAAASTGYDAAEGDLIGRIDADSVPPPDWVARLTATLTRTPAPDAVTGTGVFYDAPRGLRRPLATAYLGAYYLLGMAAAGHHVLWGSNMGMRREVWRAARTRVHRSEREVHDDMDLALVLGPDAVIRLSTTLQVGVSARSLVGLPQLRRRFRRAFRTLELNWADSPPWDRWARRWLRDTPRRR